MRGVFFFYILLYYVCVQIGSCVSFLEDENFSVTTLAMYPKHFTKFRIEHGASSKFLQFNIRNKQKVHNTIDSKT